MNKSSCHLVIIKLLFTFKIHNVKISFTCPHRDETKGANFRANSMFPSMANFSWARASCVPKVPSPRLNISSSSTVNVHSTLASLPSNNLMFFRSRTKIQKHWNCHLVIHWHRHDFPDYQLTPRLLLLSVDFDHKFVDVLNLSLFLLDLRQADTDFLKGGVGFHD